MTDFSAPQHPRGDKAIPLWLGLSVMAGIAVGGGWAVWRFVYNPPPKPHATRMILPPPTNPRVAGAPVEPADSRTLAAVLVSAKEASSADGAHVSEDGGALFKAGDDYVRARPTKDGKVELSFGTFVPPEVEWEHGYLSRAVRAMLASEEEAKRLALTAAQREKLEKLPPPPAMKWNLADQERFRQLYDRWQSAEGDAKTAAAGRMVEAIRAYAGPRREGEKKAMAERVRWIREILSKEQAAKVSPR